MSKIIFFDGFSALSFSFGDVRVDSLLHLTTRQPSVCLSALLAQLAHQLMIQELRRSCSGTSAFETERRGGWRDVRQKKKGKTKIAIVRGPDDVCPRRRCLSCVPPFGNLLMHSQADSLEADQADKSLT